MLKLEKKSGSPLIGVTLRKKNKFFTLELIQALATVVGLHLILAVLFTVKSTHPESETANQKLVEIFFDKDLVAKMVDLTVIEGPLPTNLLRPPSSPMPHLTSQIPLLKEEVNLESKPSTHQIKSAFVRGKFPQKLEIPALEEPVYQIEEGQLSIRSDSKGKIFWFEWLKKTSRTSLDLALEKWLKEIRLSAESELSPQLLEIRLYP